MEDRTSECAKSSTVVQNGSSFDRFIPFRPRLNVEDSHTRLMQTKTESNVERPPHQSLHSVMYNKLLASALNSPTSQRILPIIGSNDSGYSSPECSPCKPPICTKAMQSVLESPRRCHTRRVEKYPKCLLDIPSLRDDFYTNVFHWSSSNEIAIALGRETYTWNADTSTCSKIEMTGWPTDNFYISSLRWDPEGGSLAVANNKGTISLCTQGRILSEIKVREKATVCVMRWEDNVIYSGTDQGEIYFHDTRCPDECMKASAGHRDVCGMQLSPGTPYIATGSDDGLVIIWDIRSRGCVREIEAHIGCSRALAWCPWRSSVLASGGGSSDRYIRLWHIHTGEKMAEVYTKAQVCGLLWSEEYHELASSLASTPEYAINDIVLWKMHSFNFEPQAILQQHLGRPLHMDISPDKTTIASAGADETLCLWHCFPSQRRQSIEDRDSSPLCLNRSIR